jgi:cytoskeletal protein RodZ
MIKRVGQQLKQARIDQDITLEQASKELHIRTRFLIALEEGDLSVIPSAVQVRGFLRSYADFLKLDSQKLFDSLQQDSPSQADDQTEVEEEEIPQSTIEAAKAVTAIYEEIGFDIKQRRETLGLSLADLEEHTRIPAHYLEFIESGQFQRFPSPVQARGMLGNYVAFLEMDSNAILLRYADALQTGLAARQRSGVNLDEGQKTSSSAPSTKRLQIPLWLRSVISPDTILIGSVGIMVVVLTIWGIGRITRTISESVPQPTAPSMSEVLQPSATPQPTPTGTLLVTPTLQLLDIGGEEDQEATPFPTIPIAGPSNIQLYLIIRQRTFLRVTVDGFIEFEGRANRGSNLAFTGNQTVEVLTGNAASLQIFYNDQDLGSLGILGEVVNLVFTRDGVVIPTATPTPTLSPEQLELTPSPTTESGPDVPDPINTPVP